MFSRRKSDTQSKVLPVWPAGKRVRYRKEHRHKPGCDMTFTVQSHVASGDLYLKELPGTLLSASFFEPA
jgi:hypothetical protein